MPRSSLDHYIEPAHASDVQHLADVAAKLQVTTDALGWRLMNLRRIDESTRLRLASLRRFDDQETPKLFSQAFVQKLHGRWTRDAFLRAKRLKHEACLWAN